MSLLDSEVYQKIREIVNDKVHGSTQIALNLLKFLSRVLEKVEVERVGRVLDEVLEVAMERPSMILPINMVSILKEIVKRSIDKGEEIDIKRIVDILTLSYSQSLDKAVDNAVDALRGFRKIFTLSFSSQVLRTLRKIKDVEVLITVGWPILDGLRASRELSSSGVKTYLYLDSSINDAVTSSDAVFIGCDAILVDGTVINRSGSRTATLIAKKESIPSYVICDSLKLDSMKVWKSERWKYSLEDLEVEFHVFEKVEAEFFSEYISEMGRDDWRNFVDKALRKVVELHRMSL
ncbi:MAG: hypothetical protein NZ929_05305 [Aigarchaeota archaeon]|nr:hypothetical protein [Aigarchaeota archaeon]MCX8192697.1 hypothetical protein [Nitrososphaeria archaeon]MDW7987003.1 hypothetical protein [Nitrososphaerota archaeon]